MPEKPNEVNVFPLFTPTMEEAIELVQRVDLNTDASDSIQNAIQNRLLK